MKTKPVILYSFLFFLKLNMVTSLTYGGLDQGNPKRNRFFHMGLNMVSTKLPGFVLESTSKHLVKITLPIDISNHQFYVSSNGAGKIKRESIEEICKEEELESNSKKKFSKIFLIWIGKDCKNGRVQRLFDLQKSVIQRVKY